MAKRILSITLEEEIIKYLEKTTNNKSEYINELLLKDKIYNQDKVPIIQKIEEERLELLEKEESLNQKLRKIVEEGNKAEREKAKEILIMQKKKRERLLKLREESMNSLKKLLKDKKLTFKLLNCQTEDDFNDLLKELIDLCVKYNELSSISVANIWALKEIKQTIKEEEGELKDG